MASIGTQEKSGNFIGIISTWAKFWREVGQKYTLIFVHHKLNIYYAFTYIVQCKCHTDKCNICTELKNVKSKKWNKYERFKRFRVKSCRFISLPVKNMASGAPRGHITTGIFSTDKVFIRRQIFYQNNWKINELKNSAIRLNNKIR